MKRTLLALAVFALLLPAAHRMTAAEISVDFLYNNLIDGSWIDVADYGYGWQPEVAVSNPSWRPYADGYWAYTDVGWTWVSYEDFGWATYHYGRWARLADYGWVWFPGSDLEWGPAWVSWRTGGDYVGWAPLPPRGPGIVYEGRPIGGQVDIEFDIGPAYYNFVDVRYIGEPVLRDRIFAPSQNVTYISKTVNVTNITYNNNTVYNYGPDYNTLSAQSSRPIQRLSLERQQNVDPATAVKSGAITKVQGDKLVVAAPPKIQKPTTQVAPPAVKTKVAQPKVDRGWTGVANAAELKQKIKTENPKQIPPPTRATAAGTAAAQASPAASGSPGATAAGATTATSPVERGKGRGKAAQRGQAAATASPPVSASPAVTSPSAAGAGKHGRGRPGEQLGTSPGAGAAATAAPAASTPAEARGKHKREFERATPAAPQERPGALPRQAPPGRPQAPPPSATPFTGAGENLEERRPAQRGPERATAPAGMRPSPGEPSAEHGQAAQRGPGAERGERAPAGAPGTTEGGKKKGGPSPSPSP